MLNKKITLSGLALFDRQGMAEKFSRMAAKGWMIEKIVGNPIYIYRRTEPKNIRFAVVYINNTSNSAPLTDRQYDFVSQCHKLGWQWVTSNERIHIFATEDPDTPAIDTDPVVQVENIFASLKRELIGYTILAAMNLFYLYSNMKWYFEAPDIYFSNRRYTRLYMDIPAAVMFTMMALDYVIWYRKAKKTAAEENELYTSPFHRYVVITEVLVLLWMVLLLVKTSGLIPLRFAFGIVVAAVATMMLLNSELRKSGGDANENYWIVSVGVALVTFLLIFAVGCALIISG